MDWLGLYVLLAIAVYLTARTLFADRSPIPETSGKIRSVSSAAELDAVAASTTFVVVDFYADWCSPCRAVSPFFSDLASKYSRGGHLAFARVNISHANALAKRYHVSAVPTFVFLQHGALKAVRFEGLQGRRSVHFTNDGVVDRVRGIDRTALEEIVRTLAQHQQAEDKVDM